MGRVKKFTQDEFEDIKLLDVQVQTAAAYFNYYNVPIFIENPKLQEIVRIALPEEEVEKVRQKVEDFLTVMDTQIRKKVDKYADKQLKEMLKRVPDYHIQEYSKPEEGVEE